MARMTAPVFKVVTAWCQEYMLPWEYAKEVDLLLSSSLRLLDHATTSHYNAYQSLPGVTYSADKHLEIQDGGSTYVKPSFLIQHLV